MDIFCGFEIRTRYLPRYIVHVNFIKTSPMKYRVRVNPKNGMFLKTFLVCSQYFNTFWEVGYHYSYLSIYPLASSRGRDTFEGK